MYQDSYDPNAKMVETTEHGSSKRTHVKIGGHQVNVPHIQVMTLTGTEEEIGYAYKVLREFANQQEEYQKPVDVDLGIVFIPRVFQITKIEPRGLNCLRVSLLRLAR